MDTTKALARDIINHLLAEVAPMYVAQPILHDWLSQHGFEIIAMNGDSRWYVQETNGLNWRQFMSYSEMLTAVLDEIVKRAKEGVPTP